MGESTQAKADIIPYAGDHSTRVRSWIDSAGTYEALCRGIEFPPPPDIVDSWQRAGVRAYLLTAHNQPVAYAELVTRQHEQALEIGHLLVDPRQRSRGYGTRMLQLLYERAATTPGVARVLLNLYHQDPEALGCFLKAGFEIVGTASHVEGLRMMRIVKK